MPRKDCSINERLKDLENAIPSGESIGVLPSGFKAIPDPRLVNELTKAFKTYPVGEIPPPGLGFILQDGRIVHLGMEDRVTMHGIILQKTLKPKASLLFGSCNPIAISNLGALKEPSITAIIPLFCGPNSGLYIFA